MTTNIGIYTDCEWAVPVTFRDAAGAALDLSGFEYIAELYRDGALIFVFRSEDPDVDEGVLNLGSAATGVISFEASTSEHAGVTAGIYRLHLKRDVADDVWIAEGTMAVAEPGGNETYIRFDEVSSAETGTSLAYSQLAALSAAAAAQSAIEAAQSVIDAAEQVDLAEAQVLLAQAQVTLAAAQVALANTARSGAEAAQAAAQAAQALAESAVTAATDAGAVQVGLATNQAILAAGYAAAAASVVQQDLSGVTGAALHRSPNAITALAVYDATKDSDGGAWTEKCQHTSWWNETLNGVWLGARATEGAARAVSGATTGDYFQLTTDGKFYKLNAGSGTTEVFRGNKRDFPRLAAIVAEAASLTIYDLTEPGRPMWMRFVMGGSTAANVNMIGIAATTIGAISLVGSVLAVGSNNSYGLFVVNFASDGRVRLDASNQAQYGGGIAQRNSGLGQVVTSGVGIASAIVNAVGMTVLPDAPVDPVTGLRVPTIAVATAAGLSVIKHSGTVVSSSSASAYTRVSITAELLSAVLGASSFFYAAQPGNLGASFSLSSIGSTAEYGNGQTNGAGGIGISRARHMRATTGGLIKALRFNSTQDARSLAASLSNLYNIGWMPGDIRRALLSDVTAGSINGPDRISTGVTNLAGTASTATYDTGTGQGSVTRAADTNNQSYVTFGGLTANQRYMVTISNTGASALVLRDGLFANPVAATVNAGVTSTVFFNPSTSNLSVAAQNNSTATTFTLSALRLAVEDRSYKAAGAFVGGTLTRAALASSTSLMGFSGWSAANYLREPYSADLDFGTGEWSASTWANVPASLPDASFPTIGSEIITNGDFASGATGWTTNTTGTGTCVFTGGVCTMDGTSGNRSGVVQQLTGLTVGATYILTWATVISSGTLTVGIATSGAGTYNATVAAVLGGVGKVTFVATAATLYFTAFVASGGGSATIDNVSLKEAAPATILDRAYSSGSRLRLGINQLGNLIGEAYDGTTRRIAVATAAYNLAAWLKAELCYTTDGGLSLRVNGREVAATRGTPLLTLSNTSAALTIGNSYALDAPFPGSIALVKLGATVPTADQSAFMYEQEKQLFKAGAAGVLPDSGAIVDMTYDDATDRWIAATTANESYWTGLVRNAVVAVPAGSFSKLAAASGVELAARITTTPGVDLTMPSYNLREELLRRQEAAAQRTRELAVLEFVGGFTGNTTNGSTAIASVAGLSYPTSYIGARISGSGIPANSTIVAVSGTTIYISAAATATATGVSITFLDFILPNGLEAKSVLSAGAMKQEGSTKDWTRLFDGMAESVRFGAAPGVTAWVQIQAQRMASQ